MVGANPTCSIHSGIVRMRGFMVIQLRPCTISSTPPLPDSRCCRIHPTNMCRSLCSPLTGPTKRETHSNSCTRGSLPLNQDFRGVRGYGRFSRPEDSTSPCTGVWRCLDPGVRPHILQPQGQRLLGDGADHEGAAECEAHADVPRCPKGDQRVVTPNSYLSFGSLSIRRGFAHFM